ncbi:N-6 DNA methylase [Anaerococcus sp. Marseille-P9784]
MRCFGQELNSSTYNLLHMNIIMRDVPTEYLSIKTPI